MGKPPHYSYRSCSAMESNAIKLPVHWFCADVNVRGALELCNYWVRREFFAFMQSTHPHSAITLSDTLWMSYCGSLKNKQTVSSWTVEEGRNFTNWLLQWWHPITVIHLNSLSFTEMTHSFTNAYSILWVPLPIKYFFFIIAYFYFLPPCYHLSAVTIVSTMWSWILK